MKAKKELTEIWDNRITYLINLIIEAGNRVIQIYDNGFDVSYKDDNSPLTKADLIANEIIVNGLKEHYPEYGILAEESKDDLSRLDKKFCFLVDPIDGTKEFVKKNGQFTVNIGLVKDQKPIMGVIYVPVQKKLYYGIVGEGTYVCDVVNHENVSKKDIHVTDKTFNLTLVGSKSHQTKQFNELYEKNKDKICNVETSGSSLKGCKIAEGSADIYYRFSKTNEWDTCAMHAIVVAAGGIMRQMDHSELLYNKKDVVNHKGFYVVNRKENIFV